MVDASEIAFVAVFPASDKVWAVSGELVAATGGPGGRYLLSGDPAEPILSAGPAHLGDFVSDVAVIPAQPTRDLVHRDATNEHLAQRVHLRI
jgi:hypothetical protein